MSKAAKTVGTKVRLFDKDDTSPLMTITEASQDSFFVTVEYEEDGVRKSEQQHIFKLRIVEAAPVDAPTAVSPETLDSQPEQA